jgi:CHAD domain-containing protein
MTSAHDRRLEGLRSSDRSVGSVRDLVQRAIALSAIRLVEAEPVARAGEDPEGVHSARVGVRRLRSDLRTFGPILDPEAADRLRAELAWLADLLGPVREADVLALRLRRRIAEGEGELAPAKALVDELEAELLEARRQLLEALGSARYEVLLDEIVDVSSDAPIVRRGGRSPRWAGRLVAAPWTSLRKRARRLGSDAGAEALHAVRIRAKRVRYAAEAVRPAFGKPAKRFASAAADLQDVLGEHQDAVVAGAWLADHAIDADAETAFAAGRLAEHEAVDRARARARWRRAWKALRAEGPFWS